MSKNIWLRLYSIDEWDRGWDDRRLPRSEWKKPDATGDDHEKLVKLVMKCLIYKVSINVGTKAQFIKMNDWCEENFQRRYCLFDNQIYCQNEQDAFAFKMRWL